MTQTANPTVRRSPAPSTELGRSLAQLETVVDQCSLATLASQGRFERAFTLARGIAQLRKMITDDMMAQIMPLQGTSLGFRTDQDNRGGYGVDVVKECLIEALLRGVNPVGNEFNIISQRCYTTKEGFTRLVRDWPGLTDLKEEYGVPRMRDGGAIVECRASWKLDGRPDAIKCEIPVKVNSGMGSDAILGKTTRKLLARVYRQISGSEQTDGDAEDAAPVRAVTSTVVGELPVAGNKSERLAAQLGAKADAVPGTPAAEQLAKLEQVESVNTDTGEVREPAGESDQQPEAPADESQADPDENPVQFDETKIVVWLVEQRPEGMTPKDATARLEKWWPTATSRKWPKLKMSERADYVSAWRTGGVPCFKD
jgi:outer membrane lipoprotein SlyB